MSAVAVSLVMATVAVALLGSAGLILTTSRASPSLSLTAAVASANDTMTALSPTLTVTGSESMRLSAVPVTAGVVSATLNPTTSGLAPVPCSAIQARVLSVESSRPLRMPSPSRSLKMRLATTPPPVLVTSKLMLPAAPTSTSPPSVPLKVTGAPMAGISGSNVTESAALSLSSMVPPVTAGGGAPAMVRPAVSRLTLKVSSPSVMSSSCAEMVTSSSAFVSFGNLTNCRTSAKSPARAVPESTTSTGTLRFLSTGCASETVTSVVLLPSSLTVGVPGSVVKVSIASSLRMASTCVTGSVENSVAREDGGVRVAVRVVSAAAAEVALSADAGILSVVSVSGVAPSSPAVLPLKETVEDDKVPVPEAVNATEAVSPALRLELRATSTVTSSPEPISASLTSSMNLPSLSLRLRITMTRSLMVTVVVASEPTVTVPGSSAAMVTSKVSLSSEVGSSLMIGISMAAEVCPALMVKVPAGGV